jgi:hypothetical protein
MNPFDDLIARKTPDQVREWLEPVKRQSAKPKARASTPRIQLGPLKPPMQALCECGLRYGMHRVNDYACPNQEWRPGNGKPQWLVRKWVRA